MAVTVRNIIVGAGNLYISQSENGRTALPGQTGGTAGPAAGASMNVALDASAQWRHVGGTQEGVEIAYTPDYGEVEIDQLKDAAIMFNQGVTISMNTNLAEASLTNLLVAWGLPGAALTTSGTTDTIVLSVPGDTPVERSAAVVGNAPAGTTGARRERVYFARRVISVEASSHSLRRTEATVFPVSFRLLPDPSYAGSEYGSILDRNL